MRNLTKELFLSAVTCPTLGWLLRNNPPQQTPTPGERFRIEQGIEIGRRARSLYPGGLLIDDRDIILASKKTRSAIDDPSTSVLFEAAFLTDACAARADILQRNGDGWKLLEVKSSVNDKDEYIDDLGYTAMVLKRCGLRIASAALVLVTKEYRLGMDDNRLFLEIDHTDDVLDRAEVFESKLQQIGEMTGSPQMPEPQLIFDCRSCAQFAECTGKGIDNHIFNLPRLSQVKFDMLKKDGTVRIEDIPYDFPLTDDQEIVRETVRAGKPFIGEGLASDLARISWPACYLDFETVISALPLYADIAPYTQIPTQYSIHHCDSVGIVVSHCEYLADPKKDPRQELANRLIDDLKGQGSIIVYSNFERTIINGLAAVYPHLAVELNSLIDRIIDLQVIIKKNVYELGFHGSLSIKTVLPVLVTGMSYDDLPIADGGSAMAAFAYMAMDRYDGSQIEIVRCDLLEYCKRDTFAMVRLHASLREIALRPSAIRL